MPRYRAPALPASWQQPERHVWPLDEQTSVAAQVLARYVGDQFPQVAIGQGEGLVIAGPKGSGKTTAALGLHAAASQRHGVAAALVPLDVSSTRVLAEAARINRLGELWQALAEVPLLILDNAGCKLSVNAREVWSRVLGDRNDWMRPTVVIADRPRAEITAAVGENVASRLLRVGAHAVVRLALASG